MPEQSPVILVAHDYLTQRGGAERVALEIAKAFGLRRLIAAFYSPEHTFQEFGKLDIQPSLLNWIPVFRREPRLALPLLALCWSWRRVPDAAAVVCSSSGWAHGLRVAKGTRKIIYCHNPPRWLYQSADYLMDQPWYVRLFMRAARPLLTYWDKRAAASADIYIANSTSVAQRILRAYGREAKVIFPPVTVDPSLPMEPVPGLEPPFFLTVGRSRGYKGVQLLADAFEGLPEHKLAVAGGAKVSDPAENVILTGYVADAQLRWLYSNATALVSVSREDFGLTPIEANAFGTPALVLRAGGFLDSTDEGVSGLFIEEMTVAAIRAAVRDFPSDWDHEAILRHAAKFHPQAFHEAIRRVVYGCIA